MPELSRIQKLSKALLGTKHRLAVAAAIARCEGGPFGYQEIADDAGVNYAAARTDIHRLLAAGHVRLVDGRALEYKAEPSVYWELCSGLLDEFGSD